MEETTNNGFREDALDSGSSFASKDSSVKTSPEAQRTAAHVDNVHESDHELKQDVVKPRPTTSQGKRHRMDCEMHYGVSQRCVRDIAKEILDDATNNKNLHNWDKKLIVTPFKKLETTIRKYLSDSGRNLLNDLLIHSSVEHVLCVNGKPQSIPAIHEDQEEESKGYFFFPKNNIDGFTPGDKDLANSSQGRVVFFKECRRHEERAVLLWVHSLCIRLQNEDKAFIYEFIQRHLSLKSKMTTPYHWQPASPPEMGPEQSQKHYRRVSLSFHLTYLTMSAVNTAADLQIYVDHIPLFPLYDGDPGDEINKYHLCRASASTLMTLVIPEESANREEEIGLLRSPEGLWTALMINSPKQISDRELERHLTPISQFIRGITASLITQKENAESIHDFLKQELLSCNVNGLFDDEKFTKSNTYHRTIQGCSELRDSLDSTLRFMKKASNGKLKELSRGAHPLEKPGIEFWIREMHEELFSLRELRAQIEALNHRAQESRIALHGATAVLEARTAVQQGQQLKILAYLATLYLPLTATSSIYSMTVLPSSATLASFFVVFAVLFIFTSTPSLYPTLSRRLQSLDTSALKRFCVIKYTNPSGGILHTDATALSEGMIPETLIDPFKVTPPIFTPRKEYTRLGRYLQSLKPRTNRYIPEYHSRLEFKERFPGPSCYFYLVLWIFIELPTTVAFCYLLPELRFLLDQYRLYRMRESLFMKSAGWKLHPLAVARDIVRALCLPLWSGIVLAVSVWRVLLFLLAYIVLFSLFLLAYIVLFSCCCFCFLSSRRNDWRPFSFSVDPSIELENYS